MYVRQDGDLRPIADRPGARTRPAGGWHGPPSQGGTIAGVLSPFLTVEEAYLMASYLKGLSPANVLALGPVPARGEDQTFTPDQTKGRTGDTSFVVARPFTIHAEKCPNRRGVEAVLEHFQGEVIGFDDLSRRVKAGRVPGALRRLGRDRPLDRRGRGAGAARQGRVPGGPGHEGHPAGAAGRRRAGRGDVRREGRLLRQRRRPAPVRRGGAAAARRVAARPRPAGDPPGPGARPGPLARRPGRAGRRRSPPSPSPKGAGSRPSASCWSSPSWSAPASRSPTPGRSPEGSRGPARRA